MVDVDCAPVRSQRERGLELGRRSVDAALRVQHARQHDVRLREAWLALERRSEELGGPRELSTRVEEPPEVVARIRVCGVECDRPIERGGGAIAVAARFEADAEIEMRSRMERSAGDRLPIARDSFHQTSRVLRGRCRERSADRLRQFRQDHCVAVASRGMRRIIGDYSAVRRWHTHGPAMALGRAMQRAASRWMWPVLGSAGAIVISPLLSLATGQGVVYNLWLAVMLAILWAGQKLSRREVGLTPGDGTSYLLAVAYVTGIVGIVAFGAWATDAIDASRYSAVTVARRISLNFLVTFALTLITEDGFFRGALWGSCERAGFSPRRRSCGPAWRSACGISPCR
jgi:hypothetical protein